jgi:sugar phosphate isomerase/epimerase
MGHFAMRYQNRRSFLNAATGAAATACLAPLMPAQAAAADIRYGLSGQLWDGDGEVVKAWGGNIDEGVQETARMGFQGIEPFRQHIMQYLGDPGAFRRKLDDAGIKMLSCSNGGRGMSTNFIDSSVAPQTVKDHVAFARNFILPISGPTAFKFNMGRRPADNIVTDDHLKVLADTLNEIGRQTIAFGIKASPHPHIWGPMEREHEVRRTLELTDPKFVFITADTAHLTLGGMDPLKIMSEYFPRIAEVHYKDCDPKYIGNTQTPTQKVHAEKSLYLDLGAGGVNLPAIHKMVLGRNYKGWISLDYDAPRVDEHQTVEQKILVNKRYLVDVLHVTSLGPSKVGQSQCDYVCKPPTISSGH